MSHDVRVTYIIYGHTESIQARALELRLRRFKGAEVTFFDAERVHPNGVGIFVTRFKEGDRSLIVIGEKNFSSHGVVTPDELSEMRCHVAIRQLAADEASNPSLQARYTAELGEMHRCLLKRAHTHLSTEGVSLGKSKGKRELRRRSSHS